MNLFPVGALEVQLRRIADSLEILAKAHRGVARYPNPNQKDESYVTYGDDSAFVAEETAREDYQRRTGEKLDPGDYVPGPTDPEGKEWRES